MADLIQEQATTYTPGENDLVYNTVVTMGSYSSPQPVVIKQYDSLPIIAATMRKDGNDYQVPDGAAVNIRLHKRSGTFIYSSVKGISQDRKIAYIQLTSNMTAVYGRTMPCLEIVVNGSVACTGDMVWDIQRNPVQEDDVKDTSEGQSIQEMAAQVQAFEDTYQEALDYMNNVTNQSRINNAASNAQAAQQAATNAANSADEAEEEANRAATESAKALGFRSFHGGQVVPGATDGDLDPSRPMSTPTAASVTIKARGDRIAGLTMAGKTTQAGSGDPSPDNIRMISGVGQYDQCIVLDGSENWLHNVSWENSLSFSSENILGVNMGIAGGDFEATATAKSSYLEVSTANAIVNTVGAVGIGFSSTHVYVAISGITSAATLKSYLSDHPLTVWYRSVDYAKSTGPFYVVVELSDDPYRAVGFELNQPLFDGDSLKVGGKSGYNKMVVLDGSEDEDWRWMGSGGTAYAACYNSINIGDLSSVIGYLVSDKFNTVTILSDNKIIGLGGWTKQIYLRDPNKFTSEATLRNYLSQNPLTVFYKSVDYTEENDIPVALEKHERAQFHSSTGTYNANNESPYAEIRIPSSAAHESAFICNRAKYPGGQRLNYGDGYIAREGNTGLILGLVGSGIENQSALDSELEAHPVQVVYKLATPVTYARPVPTMIAQPGEDGTFTVTGENSLSVLLKAFQDGGNAARLEGHTWDDIMAAIDQKIASLASMAMEVN